MNLKLRLINIMVLILFSVIKANAQMGIKQPFDNFILVKNLPNSNEIILEDLFIDTLFSSSVELNNITFLKALNSKPKFLKPSDKTLSKWHYAPWANIIFSTSEGKYEIELFFGGLGFVTLPSQKKGAVLFDFTKKEKP